MYKTLLCYLLIILFSARASADAGVGLYIPDAGSVKNEAPVGSVIAPINKAQPAPFSGVLFSPASAAWVITEFKNVNQKTKIEVDKARAEESAKGTFLLKETEAKWVADKKIASAKIDSQAADILFLSDKLKKVENVSNLAPLYVGLGVTGGIVLTLLTVWAVSSATK